MKHYFVLFTLLLGACSLDTAEPPVPEVETASESAAPVFEEGHYHLADRQMLTTILNSGCPARDYRFIDFYTVLDSIPADTNDRLVLVDSFKTKGYVVTNHGRGNWPGGPRMVSVTLANNECVCQVDKLYHLTQVEGSYSVTERIKCRLEHGKAGVSGSPGPSE